MGSEDTQVEGLLMAMPPVAMMPQRTVYGAEDAILI